MNELNLNQNNIMTSF